MPEPLPAFVTVSHDAELVAVHEHAPAALTVTEPDEGSAAEETELGEIEMSHVPAWLTVTVLPAIVSVPVRGAVAVLAATWNVTPASPVLFGPAPDVIVIHETLLTEVHTHAVGIWTETMPVPPAASSDSVVGVAIAVHDAAAWLIVRSRPAIVMEPVRAVPAGLGST